MIFFFYISPVDLSLIKTPFPATRFYCRCSQRRHRRRCSRAIMSICVCLSSLKTSIEPAPQLRFSRFLRLQPQPPIGSRNETSLFLLHLLSLSLSPTARAMQESLLVLPPKRGCQRQKSENTCAPSEKHRSTTRERGGICFSFLFFFFSPGRKEIEETHLTFLSFLIFPLFCCSPPPKLRCGGYCGGTCPKGATCPDLKPAPRTYVPGPCCISNHNPKPPRGVYPMRCCFDCNQSK